MFQVVFCVSKCCDCVESLFVPTGVRIVSLEVEYDIVRRRSRHWRSFVAVVWVDTIQQQSYYFGRTAAAMAVLGVGRRWLTSSVVMAVVATVTEKRSKPTTML